MEAVKKAKCCNPVILCENVDKIKDEKLRRLIEQLVLHKRSHSFVDRCIQIPFDLSNVLFLQMPESDVFEEHLWDTTEKKIELIKTSVLPSILAQHGLEERASLFNDDLLRTVIDECISEMGIDKCRGALISLAYFLKKNPQISLPSAAFDHINKKREQYWTEPTLKPYQNSKNLPVGVATMLAVDYFFEKGRIMCLRTTFSPKSSINGSVDGRQVFDIAYNYVCSNRKRLGISSNVLRKHFNLTYDRCEGFSLGCATFLSLFSLLTNRRIRNDTAVSGQISLSGQILAIGGVYYKTYAAYKWGARRIVFTSQNKEDVENTVDDKLKTKMEFVYVDTIDELIEATMEERKFHKRADKI